MPAVANILPRPGRRTPAVSAAALALLAALLIAACGGEAPRETAASFASESGHVHGIDLDPGDDAILIATHGGVFRIAEGSEEAARVGPAQDMMGFAVAGPDRFYASGHPAPGGSGPDHLGLIESSDGGRTWEEVSLGGRADFHALEYSGGTLIGYNGLSGELMVSADGGRTWTSGPTPAPLLDLAVDPGDATHIVATSEAGLIERKGGGRWGQLDERIGLLAWPEDGPLYIVEAGGAVSSSGDGGASWKSRGELPSTPVAFTAGGGKELYAVLEDGSVMVSEDGGARWSARASP